MRSAIKNISSLRVWQFLVVTSLAWLIILHPFAHKSFKVIEWDVTLYYTYLPATFIYHDIKFEKNWGYNLGKHQFGLNTDEAGNRYIKMTSGMALMYSPFFAIGHAYAKLFTPDKANGYTTPYRVALSFGSFFYIIMGLWFLRKVLLRFFDDNSVSWTLAIVFLGTNLLHYTVWRGAMSHGYSFALSCLLLYAGLRYRHEQKLWQMLLVGLTSGLIFLIRPVNALIPLVVGTYLLLNIIKGKIQLRPWHWVLMLTISFIAISPQLFYWKYVTGNWVVYSYGEEGFFFNDPQIINGLFSFRKGWLLYSPLMLLSMFGMWPLFKTNKKLSILILVMLILAIYVTFSWWTWWYGGSFGSRPMIDFYGILALPIAAAVQYFLNKKQSVKVVFKIAVVLLIALSIFQNHQYQKGIIHFDSMSKETYKLIFLKDHIPQGYQKSLDPPDYDAALKGDRD